MNGPLAKYYGIPSVEGPEWRRVDGVKQYGRGGVIGQAAVLAKESGASRTSPILRGNWILEVLLGEKLRGGFTLVQIERRSISFSRSDYLLLIKSRDEYADPSWDIESLRFDRSVITDLSLKEINDGKPIKPEFSRRRV